ncbi:hypothetical protein LOAG_15973 [Loa loa]|uniref:Uncharacterized protein n=1 Tax=Loa loa TaxID=7209 RepID=A0A1S0TEG9_LOALO|nr:hypothetical protein LOAG_15973 [Loa loa]EFO12560.1 hypothetical protein LOAG_15973 [Loa loa]
MGQPSLVLYTIKEVKDGDIKHRKLLKAKSTKNMPIEQKDTKEKIRSAFS